MMRAVALALLVLPFATTVRAETIIVQPGGRMSLHIQGKSDVTYKCASPGACNLAGGSSISNSNNVTLDGFTVRGSAQGLTISSSDNVTIQNSTFIEQTSAGISVQPGGASHNVVVRNNEFLNAKRGCNYVSGDCSGHLSDGSPVANMDYGVRAYGEGTTIQIADNHFTSLFNHAISLKSGVANASITGNTFDSCGRTCMELGQESMVGSALIANNVLRGSTMTGIWLKQIRQVAIRDNTFQITGRVLYDSGGVANVSQHGDTQGGWGGGIPDWGGGVAEPPYVYVPPVIEDAAHRRQRVLDGGSPAADARRQRVIGAGPPTHNCCDDPNNPIDPSVMARLLRMQAAGPP